MGQHYRHLSEQDRIFLSQMVHNRYPVSKIARVLGFHRSTIYRELRRNSWQNYRDRPPEYTYFMAQRNYKARRQRRSKLEKLPHLRTYVHGQLLKGWSPWQIEGRLRTRLAASLESGPIVTHETIYSC